MNDKSRLKQRLYEAGILPVLDSRSNLPAARIASELTQGGVSALVLEPGDHLSEQIKAIKQIRPDLLIGICAKEPDHIPVVKGADFCFAEVHCAGSQGDTVPIIPVCRNSAEIESHAAKGAEIMVLSDPPAVHTLHELYREFPQISFLLDGRTETYLSEPNVLAVFNRSILMETPDMAPGDITKRADAVMNQAYNITTGHLGINMENREQAVALADTLSALFGKPWRETGKSFLVGDLVEIMKMIYLGEKGHMGILTDDLRRSIRFYQTKGAAFNMATYEENAIVYFAREYGGVAFHLTQRPKERGNEVL